MSKVIYNNCKCGNKKQITSIFCRNCYTISRKQNTLVFNCSCGKKISDKATQCVFCYGLKRSAEYEENSIAEVVLKTSNKKSYYVKIRTHAQRKMKLLGYKKECNVCGYDFYVELAHIKAIHSFKKTTKLKIVNNINNLIYLCPNHHKELDKGKIKLDTLFAGWTGSSSSLGSYPKR